MATETRALDEYILMVNQWTKSQSDAIQMRALDEYHLMVVLVYNSVPVDQSVTIHILTGFILLHFDIQRPNVWPDAAWALGTRMVKALDGN